MTQNFEESYNKNLLLSQQANVNNTNQKTYSDSLYNSNQKQNLVEFELTFDSEINSIERLLRGDIEVTENGNTFWTEPFKDILVNLYKDNNDVIYYVFENQLIRIQLGDDFLDFDKIRFKSEEGYLKCDLNDISNLNISTNEPEFIGYKKIRITDTSRTFLNDLGVNDMLRNIITLVNKNKALSNYNEEEINQRVRQLKHEIRTLIYNNYEDYGIDNEYKMNNYSMTVLSVGSIVEDVYRRAMNGETHKGLTEQRLVTQTEPLSPQSYQPQAQAKKHWWNFNR